MYISLEEEKGGRKRRKIKSFGNAIPSLGCLSKKRERRKQVKTPSFYSAVVVFRVHFPVPYFRRSGIEKRPAAECTLHAHCSERSLAFAPSALRGDDTIAGQATTYAYVSQCCRRRRVLLISHFPLALAPPPPSPNVQLCRALQI